MRSGGCLVREGRLKAARLNAWLGGDLMSAVTCAVSVSRAGSVRTERAREEPLSAAAAAVIPETRTFFVWRSRWSVLRW